MNGIFNINKPAGMTSFDVVAAVRRLAHERRVGHAGTLDPLAVGVLPVCVGQATRVVEYLTDSRKGYCGEIVLGIATDTDDAEGRITAKTDPSGITREQIEQTLTVFLGKIEQVPPAYSAIKVGGKKLYELARAGKEAAVVPRQVEIFGIDLLYYETPVAVIRVECSKGTYIRSLARDIGIKLGVGAYLRSLIRTKSGPFGIDDAISLSDLALAFEFDFWRSIIYPIDEALLHWPAIIVGSEREDDICNGRSIQAGSWLDEFEREGQGTVRNGSVAGPPDRCRAYGFDGQFLAVLALDTGARLWRPQKVFCVRE